MPRYFKYIVTLKKAVPELSSAHLLNYLQYNGWTIIYSDKAAGQEMLKRFGLEERAKNNPAFTAKSGKLHLVVTKQSLSEKDSCQLILHETGHILLNHNVSCLSNDEEKEASRFTKICMLTYSLWEYRWWISVVGAVIALFVVSGTIQAAPKGCECCFCDCCK